MNHRQEPGSVRRPLEQYAGRAVPYRQQHAEIVRWRELREVLRHDDQHTLTSGLQQERGLHEAEHAAAAPRLEIHARSPDPALRRKQRRLAVARIGI
ncbi:MAG: hypothetical protein DMD40_02220 [Gemmatimonadetes bacterium]|nr:MAG: hypothetical protein DMD40_02220 [Gemmatimonadota bacterium]